MKKVFSFLIILCLLFNTSINCFADTKNDNSNLKKKNSQVKVIKYDDFTIKITTIKDSSSSNNKRKSANSSHDFDANDSLLTIIAFETSRQFYVTKHAMDNLAKRFNGSFELIAKALTKGKMFKDTADGGYIAYFNETAVSLSDDFQTVKTVMSAVNLSNKLHKWKAIGSVRQNLWEY